MEELTNTATKAIHLELSSCLDLSIHSTSRPALNRLFSYWLFPVVFLFYSAPFLKANKDELRCELSLLVTYLVSREVVVDVYSPFSICFMVGLPYTYPGASLTHK